MLEFKTLDFARESINSGGHVNQRVGKDTYCQIVVDDLVVGFITPAEYKLLVQDPRFKEKQLPEDKKQGFRRLKIIIKADSK